MSTRFGFVSTFPPTQCGLATFSTAAATAPQLLWPVIADQYRELAGRLVMASVAA